MLSTSLHRTIDGYSHVSHINVSELQTWYAAFFLITSNFVAIIPWFIATGIGFYAWSIILLIAFIISISYHTCQTTSFCPLYISLHTWQKLDHTSAGALLAFTVLLFIFYRPPPSKKQEIENKNYKKYILKKKQYLQQRKINDRPALKNLDYFVSYSGVGLGSFNTKIISNDTHIKIDPYFPYNNGSREDDDNTKKDNYEYYNKDYDDDDNVEDDEIEGDDTEGELFYNELEYDRYLSQEDKEKVCYKCRGVNPLMIYDWQSVVVSYVYIFIIIIAIEALPLTLQSFVIIIVFGILLVGLKIALIEEGNPTHLFDRYHAILLSVGIGLLILSLVFYFIDGFMSYPIFHTLWHILSFTSFAFVVVGISRNLPWWERSIGLCKSLCCCCTPALCPYDDDCKNRFRCHPTQHYCIRYSANICCCRDIIKTMKNSNKNNKQIPLGISSLYRNIKFEMT